MTKIRIPQQVIDAYFREVLDQSVLVTMRQASQILSVSESTLRRRVEERMLTPYVDPVGGSTPLRFLASELRDYVRTLRADLLDG
jgi:predicted DNA-binding transcriptional regulator AlpA